MYIIREHVCSMCLADALKVLLKNIPLMETIISTAASQSKNDVTEASVTILNKDDCRNFFHCWQILNTSVTSFDQARSHEWTDNNVRYISFVFMIAQYLMCMAIYTRKGIALIKYSWKLPNDLRIQVVVSCLFSFSSIRRVKDIQLGVGRLTAFNWSQGALTMAKCAWIWKAFNPPLLLLLLARSSAETMSQPKEVNTKAALYWRRLSLKRRPLVSVLASKFFKYSGGSNKSCSWTDPCLFQYIYI